MTRGFRAFSIRAKLIVLMMLISGAVLALAAASFLVIEVRSARHEVEAEISSMAGIIGFNSRAALVFGDREAAERTLDALKLKPEIAGAWLLDADGEVFARYLRLKKGQPQSAFGAPPAPAALGEPLGASVEGERKYLLGDGSLLLYHPIILDGEQAGALVLQAGMGQLEARTAAFFAATVLILLLSGLTAFLLASWLQRFISRPIADLTGVMARVSAAKDYSLRLRSRSEDEIGQLLGGFNAMLAEIEQRDRQLEEANRLLEQRVEERTEALDRANRELLEKVSERQQAEKALRESETHFRSLFENSPVPLWEEDFAAVKTYLDGLQASGIEDLEAYFCLCPEAVRECARRIRILDVNQATVRMFKAASKQELLGNLEKVFTEESFGQFQMELVALAQGKTRIEVEGINQALDGERKFVNMRLSVVPGHEETLARVIVSLVDLTERRRNEEALRQSEERFREMVDLLPQTIFEADGSGRLTFANRVGMEAFGYASADLERGLTVFDTVAPGEREAALPSLRRVFSGEKIGPVERTMVRKDGSVFPALIHAGPILRGFEPAGIRGLIIDISERRQAEEALRMLGKALETTRVGITITNLQGEIVFTNPAEASMHGYEIGELLGQKSQTLGPSELRSAFPPPELITTERESLNLRKDGSVFPVRLVSDLVADAAGNPLAVVTVCEDITERKETEARLKASVTEKDILLKEVHHRVKNNLQIISSLLNLQLKKISDAKTRAELNATRNRIRSMALIHAKLFQSENLPKINFAEYIEEFSRQLRSLYDVSPRKVQLVLEVESVYLDVDVAIPCGMIINELLTNALKYAFPENRPGEIRVRLWSEAAATVLSVEDDGVGLPPEIDIESVDTLGLQLVRSLAHQIKGTVTVERNAGTRVVVRCPAAGSAGKAHT